MSVAAGRRWVPEQGQNLGSHQLFAEGHTLPGTGPRGWTFHRGAKRRSLIPEVLSRQIGASIALQLLSLQYSNKVEYTKREYQMESFLEYYRSSQLIRVKWLGFDDEADHTYEHYLHMQKSLDSATFERLFSEAVEVGD